MTEQQLLCPQKQHDEVLFVYHVISIFRAETFSVLVFFSILTRLCRILTITISRNTFCMNVQWINFDLRIYIKDLLAGFDGSYL